MKAKAEEKAASKAAAKAEAAQKSATKKTKKTKSEDEVKVKVEDPEAELEAEMSVEVRVFEHEGSRYLKDDAGAVSADTHEELGMWDATTQKIELRQHLALAICGRRRVVRPIRRP